MAQTAQWLSEDLVSPEWINDILDINCTSCVARDISNATAPRSCFVLEFLPAGVSPKLVLKQVEPDTPRISLSVQLGLAREALFYNHFGEELEHLPHIYYAVGDMCSGVKCIVMECLDSYVDSGALFGPGNPHNWRRDLMAIRNTVGNPLSRQVARVSFATYASLHRSRWGQREQLRELRWLRGASRSAWEADQALAASRYREGVVQYTWLQPRLRALVDKALLGISWDSRASREHLDTLVHGDCWPGNVMYRGSPEGVRLVDWEMAGIGSGPQELGQYMISNMDPQDRRACERELLEGYHAALRLQGYSFEQCWREYQVGGVERWIWFICWMVAAPEMNSWTDYFQRQLLHFVEDHGIGVDDISQPRP